MAGKGGWRILTAAGLLAALLSGCGKGGDDDTVKPKLDSLWAERLKYCSECHDPDRDPDYDGPDMSTQASFLAGLKEQDHSDYGDWNIGSDCSGVPFIDPEKPGNSLIMAALVLSYSDQISADHGKCDTSYSYHNDVSESFDAEKDADLISALKTWIANGAKDN
ncbi:hypothetical protein [Thiohalorhabdus methylotrophus]|uniref:Cytochrome c domain-containing protein n=1 Tax=Thiohalorhabdus methylotrophus TaxID=3242694 RepID=A0ABV4TWH5_9GAMM